MLKFCVKFVDCSESLSTLSIFGTDNTDSIYPDTHSLPTLETDGSNTLAFFGGYSQMWPLVFLSERQHKLSSYITSH